MNITLFVFAVWVSGVAGMPAGIWEQQPSCPEPMGSYAQAAAAVGDDIYFTGGKSKKTFKYEVKRDSWEDLGEQLPVMLHHASMENIGGWLLIFGGKDDQFSKEMYSMQTSLPTLRKWIAATALWQGQVPSARNAHSTALAGGSIWMFGGWDENQYFNELYRFNIGAAINWMNFSSKVWSLQNVEGDEPAPRNSQTLVTYGGNLYMFGGFSHDTVTGTSYTQCDNEAHKCKYFNDLWRFDIDDSEWTMLSPSTLTKPCGRWGHSAVVLGESMIVYGGNAEGQELLGDLWAFNFNTRSWNELQQNGGPAPGYDHSAVVIGSSIFFYGGVTTDAPYGSNLLWKYTPSGVCSFNVENDAAFSDVSGVANDAASTLIVALSATILVLVVIILAVSALICRRVRGYSASSASLEAQNHAQRLMEVEFRGL